MNSHGHELHITIYDKNNEKISLNQRIDIRFFDRYLHELGIRPHIIGISDNFFFCIYRDRYKEKMYRCINKLNEKTIYMKYKGIVKFSVLEIICDKEFF